jgi:hypothetical protein
MRAELLRVLLATLEAGEAVAVATVVGGPGLGEQLVVWRAGQCRGDLGSPRLNQRAALYGEQLLLRPRPVRKSFEIQGERIEVFFDVPSPAVPPGEPPDGPVGGPVRA